MMTAEQNGTRKKPRRRDSDSGWSGPYLEHASQHAPAAARAYSLAIWSMVPFLGLVLGLLAVALAWLALRRERGNPEFRGKALCVASILLGGLCGLTQWTGLALMILGWPAG